VDGNKGEKTMVKVGVLGLQGAVREHVQALQSSGADAFVIKKPEQLAEIDGLVLPGGESTTMRRLMDIYGFMDVLKEFAEQGKPIFGTCAGMILLATEIEGQDDAHLKLIDMKVARNAFGRQVDSFEADLPVKGVGNDFNAVFIRAPYVISVGEDTEVLATYNDNIVAVQQGHFLAAAFHPELTDDFRMHEYFVDMVKTIKEDTCQFL
jgi:pyridoxal 5'-phosphate synthase pdxT subunit